MLDKGGLLETMGPGSVICGVVHLHAGPRQDARRNAPARKASTCSMRRSAAGSCAADDGTMLTLCGGSEAVFERAEPICARFSSDIVLSATSAPASSARR